MDIGGKDAVPEARPVSDFDRRRRERVPPPTAGLHELRKRFQCLQSAPLRLRGDRGARGVGGKVVAFVRGPRRQRRVEVGDGERHRVIDVGVAMWPGVGAVARAENDGVVPRCRGGWCIGVIYSVISVYYIYTIRSSVPLSHTNCMVITT